MALQINQEWPDEHADSSYPFADRASLISSDNGLQLDRRWFIDARLWPITNDSRIYLRSIRREGDIVAVSVAGTSGVLGEATANVSTGRRAVFVDRFNRQIGYVETSAGWGFMADYPEDTYRFGISATEFVPTVVTPLPKGGVSSVVDQNGAAIPGQWRFVGGEGIELIPTQSGFRINIIGDELYRRDSCEIPEELGLIMHPVRRIEWRDIDTGISGEVRPKRGRILTAVVGSDPSPPAEGPRDRGHLAPGPEGSIVHQMGRNG